MSKPLEVRPVSEARADFVPIVTRMGADGLHASPVIVGRRRVPEAAIISYALYELLAEEIDAILSAPQIRQRLAATAAAGGPTHTTLEGLAAAAGINPDDLDDGPGARR
ncbi:type II toxin-antitoxin system Phd/YefM family antitoxin [Streptosporangium sp. NPDC003464]